MNPPAAALSSTKDWVDPAQSARTLAPCNSSARPADDRMSEATFAPSPPDDALLGHLSTAMQQDAVLKGQSPATLQDDAPVSPPVSASMHAQVCALSEPMPVPKTPADNVADPAANAEDMNPNSKPSSQSTAHTAMPSNDPKDKAASKGTEPHPSVSRTVPLAAQPTVPHLCTHARHHTAPKVPYDKLPPYQKSRAGALAVVPNSTYRYILHPSFKSHRPQVIATATCETLSQLFLWLELHLTDERKPDVLMRQCDVHIHDIGTTHVADIFWPALEGLPCLQGLNGGPVFALSVDGHDAKHHSTGPMCSKHDISIHTRIPQTSDIESFQLALGIALGPQATIVDLWRLDVEIPGVPGEYQWIGYMQALVSLWGDDMVTPTKDPVTSAKALPGYIDFGGKSCFLAYLNRRQWCANCKASASTFHEKRDCTRSTCNKCTPPNHLVKDCPKGKGDREKAASRAESVDAAR